jgi:electron transfer flavoprotein beta subunit
VWGCAREKLKIVSYYERIRNAHPSSGSGHHNKPGGSVQIFVCVKRVPDTESQITIAADQKSIATEDLNYIVNPYDEYAIEAALQLKEAMDAEVVLLMVGEDGSQPTIRKALAMGADRAVLLQVEKDLQDPAQVAEILVSYLKNQDYALLLAGKQGADMDHASTAMMVAQRLDLPAVSAISHLEKIENGVKVQREVEAGTESYSLTLPCMLTADKGLNEPRFASLKGIMMAKRKPLDAQEVATPIGNFQVDALEMPVARKAGRILGEGAAQVPELIRLLKEEAKVL